MVLYSAAGKYQLFNQYNVQRSPVGWLLGGGMISILFMRLSDPSWLSAVSCTSLVQVVMSLSLFFASVSVRLKGGGGKRVKGERSQCIVTLVPMVFLAVRSAIVWFS